MPVYRHLLAEPIPLTPPIATFEIRSSNVIQCKDLLKSDAYMVKSDRRDTKGLSLILLNYHAL